VQTTRARIVDLLRGGDATVENITIELALAPATVRRHLDVLLRDGLVEMRSERLPLGRPHFVFTLSEVGLEAQPGHHFHLVAAVLETILALAPKETAGRSGRQIAELVFDRLAEQLLLQCRPAVTAAGIPQRVQQAIEVLTAAGLDFEVSPREEGYVINGSGCPCTHLLSGMFECPHETEVLSALVGVPVERFEATDATTSRLLLLRSVGEGVL
jgi:predicted ArsR family transcriptional regulator